LPSAHRHDAPARVGILLVNLGTPAAPTTGAVRRYLREFLSDPRVVEIPRAAWLPILHGVILNVRPAKSARKYASIWTPEGSPLMVHTARQAARVRERLQATVRQPVEVAFAMRYGEPSIPATIDRLTAAGVDRLLVVPLYPQYAASTTASVQDRLFATLSRLRNVPEPRVVRHFHDDPGYIRAVAAGVRRHWAAHGRGDRLLMSFHGLPRYTLDRGDPYFCECHKTARLLAAELGLSEAEWRITFQSRFGRAKWLEPYTTVVLDELARGGTRRVDVVCPGFVADCLETLEEIGAEAREAFVHAGGEALSLAPCLNDADDWIDALTALVLRHAGHWIDPDWNQPDEREAAQARVERAKREGAPS